MRQYGEVSPTERHRGPVARGPVPRDCQCLSYQSGIKATVARGPVPRERQCLSYSGIETGMSLLRVCIETRRSLLPMGIETTVARGPVPRDRECLFYRAASRLSPSVGCARLIATRCLSYQRHFLKTESGS